MSSSVPEVSAAIERQLAINQTVAVDLKRMRERKKFLEHQRATRDTSSQLRLLELQNEFERLSTDITGIEDRISHIQQKSNQEVSERQAKFAEEENLAFEREKEIRAKIDSLQEQYERLSHRVKSQTTLINDLSVLKTRIPRQDLGLYREYVSIVLEEKAFVDAHEKEMSELRETKERLLSEMAVLSFERETLIRDIVDSAKKRMALADSIRETDKHSQSMKTPEPSSMSFTTRLGDLDHETFLTPGPAHRGLKQHFSDETSTTDIDPKNNKANGDSQTVISAATPNPYSSKSFSLEELSGDNWQDVLGPLEPEDDQVQATPVVSDDFSEQDKQTTAGGSGSTVPLLNKPPKGKNTQISWMEQEESRIKDSLRSLVELELKGKKSSIINCSGESGSGSAGPSAYSSENNFLDHLQPLPNNLESLMKL